MGKTRNPNGMGSFTKLKDGRYKWKQMIDGELRQITARTPTELKEKIKQVQGLPITKSKIKAVEWFEKWLGTYVLKGNLKNFLKNFKKSVDSH